MRNTIAVMNTKGGVGKSTLVLALAETFSAYHGKNVLVVDSDSQASVSSMLMTIPNLHRLQQSGLTMVDFLVAEKGLTAQQAYQLTSIAGHVAVTQLVDLPNLGVHVKMPKSIFTR